MYRHANRPWRQPRRFLPLGFHDWGAVRVLTNQFQKQTIKGAVRKTGQSLYHLNQQVNLQIKPSPYFQIISRASSAQLANWSIFFDWQLLVDYIYLLEKGSSEIRHILYNNRALTKH